MEKSLYIPCVESQKCHISVPANKALQKIQGWNISGWLIITNNLCGKQKASHEQSTLQKPLWDALIFTTDSMDDDK